MIGQYLGFLALVLVSLIGFLGRFVFPREWLGILGLVPIAIGFRSLFNRTVEDTEAELLRQMDRTAPSPRLGIALAPSTHAVAAVTFANGGDNMGLYTPLFANSDFTQLIITIGTFLVLVAVWCIAAQRFARQRRVAEHLTRYGRIALPFVLIGLGVYIIAEANTLALLADHGLGF